MDEMIFETQTGEKATFVVQVLFRQNSTWQGTIHWTRKTRRSIRTRSKCQAEDDVLRRGSQKQQ
jgi:hypothetical protein